MNQELIPNGLTDPLQGFIIPISNCPKFFVPDEIIATCAPFVKLDNTFYYI